MIATTFRAVPQLLRHSFALALVVSLPACDTVESAYDQLAAGGSDPPAVKPQTLTSHAQLRAGLSPADLVSADRTIQEALETALSNQNRRWVGASNGTYGFITPIRTFRIKTGHYCREFLETIAKDANVLTVTKTACRDDDGIWKEVRPRS